ncbi:uncharacterized protein si:dkey-92i15.4 [Silurus meridionalis]|uniref:PDZ domain-containing protein n=1 Tax=Silurus meridionalis TaxID=175797 RepID=A0A8T0BMT3_SILME|nr:uncharacterized protein si:dkey-92i15.4 [Silurus meridionalis]XP_046704182.1 uncharacterized protein si:dkey-92i15.4 [Silurus meridionalis]XP_046704183.1 uncharacterized protein si:dkey-92i15.4 [Silurus meridionalis]XP_046704185.1 uncharacterized protein si:dkey-92i15.4 [Silurus meridionalis]KAF7708225.1 hypothetical protein HF521_017282 [Silurus meridionalis]
MDISVGSTCVPENSLTRVVNIESPNCSEKQNQSKPPAAPTQSAVKFQVRSAKEREQLLAKPSLKPQTLEKASRSSKGCREEMPTVHTISSQSPSLDTNMLDNRIPKLLNQVDLTNRAGLSTGSEMSNTTQKKPDNVQNLTPKVRGRTDWRQAYQSNRSKSLDWRGSRSGAQQEIQTNAIKNTTELEGRFVQRSESLQANDGSNSPSSSILAQPLKKVSLTIQPLSGTRHRKLAVSGLASSAESVIPPVRTVALAQSFPSRLKTNQNQDKTEEGKLPWISLQSGTDPADHHLRSQTTPSKVIESTGNNSVMGGNNHTPLEDKSKASSVLSPGLTTPAPFVKVEYTGLNRSSLDRLTPFVNTTSYKPENCGTFPKSIFKKKQINSNTLPDTSFVSPIGKENLVTMSTRSVEKPLSQDSRPLVNNSSIYEERNLTSHMIGLGTQSLGRTKCRHLTSPTSYSAFGLNNNSSTQKEIEKPVENTTGMNTIPGKQALVGVKPQSSQSVTADSEKHHNQEQNVRLELGSSGDSSKKSETLLENVQETSLFSVRNKIHKFEALALQNQNSSRIQNPRRAFSVTEKPKVATCVKKHSDRSLSLSGSDWSKEFVTDNLFSESGLCDEASSRHDSSGPVQIKTQPAGGSRAKTQNSGTKTQEPKVALTLNLDTFSLDHNNTKCPVITKHVDEPDSSKGSNVRSFQKLKNIQLPEEKVRDYVSSSFSHNPQKSSGITNASHMDNKEIFPIRENTFPKSTKDESFLTPGSTPVLPNSDSSTIVKSTLLTGNSDHSKSPSNFHSDLAVGPPIQVASSDSGELSHPYHSMQNEKAAAKVIRWIMDKGVDENGEDYDDDEDDEGTERGYDSDSGESSVTITSHMSNRSFSMSLEEICSLGGLDLPLSDGSMDDENWMSKRTVSLSSDVSALSAVTLLSMDELDCLLNDVRSLEDDALENYDDVHVVVLHKEAGTGLGFTVAGGVDQNKPVTVHRVLRGGTASQEGSIHVGDQVLSINGNALHNSTHKEALHTMRKARGRPMAVVVIRRGDVTETCYTVKDSPQKAAGNRGSRLRVTLNKASSDLGFSLEGGVGSNLGDKPLTVQRLFQGGPVGKVFPGDELLEVEGQSLEGLRRLEVWHLIKRLPPGPVDVLLQRPYK